MLKSLALAALVGVMATPALAQIGNAAMPIEIKMQRGTDIATVHGLLRQNGDCCIYVFKARAGQRMYWREHGAAVRMVITYPDGNSDGPGLPNPQPLTETGTYTLAISPDLMAEGAFGRYTLTIRIPPR